MDNSEQNSREIPISIIVFIIILSILFGGNTVAVKIAFKGFGIFTSAGIRFTIAAMVISCWAFYTRRPFRLKRGQLKHITILSLVFSMQLGIFYIGLANTYASRATLIMNMQPFLLLILAHFFIPGDQVSIKKIISMAFGFTGVLLLFADGFSEHIRYGDFAVLTTATLWAINATYIKKIIGNFRSFQLVLYPMYFSGPLYLFIGYFIDDPVYKTINWSIVFAMFYQAFITASFGFIMWNSLLKKYKATSVHNFIFIMPISGVIASSLILNEPITSNIILSLIFIIAGIVLLQYRFNGFKP
ncbi:MAG: DMT family transporter [Desulfobacterales bacterium]|nr:DMT family transporter [Desulfobacterales bacterium]MCP4163004.1 DMT family transporter [Deltaproteobacteria bacterium]